jgi:DNA-binding response OmpR family regulator
VAFHADGKTIVLVVEDDPELRGLYRATLGAEGYAVVAFEDGLDALRYIEGGDVPAVVILDLELPRVSGRDVYHELTAHPNTANIPIIIVSAGDLSDLNRNDFACVIATRPSR